MHHTNSALRGAFFMGGSMIKRFFLSLALLVGLLSPAYPAGTISLSMSQQFDNLGKPLNGGKLYFFAAGSTTPQSAYQDSDLTLPLPNPITLDSAGRVPQLFFADGQIKIRLTNALGVTQLAADNILVVGPSGGGGGGGSVDATTVLATGDLKARYGTGALTGFVRANGRTIGSASSGATERANADCQALFEYLWGADANLTVSTGRGVSANADWVANKTITLPNGQGKAVAGLDDMGATAGGWFTGATFVSGNATTLGSIIGAARRTLTAAQIPSITSVNAAQAISVNSTVTNIPYNVGRSIYSPSGSGENAPYWPGAFVFGTITSTGSNSISVTSNNTSGQAHDTISPYLLITYYLKL